MSKMVSREQLLQCLEVVAPGLSPKSPIDQSSCFAFRDGYVHTFNDEMSCSTKSPFDKDVEGAVQANKLIDMLRKFSVKAFEVEFTEAVMSFTARHEYFDVKLQKEILMPLDKLEKPEEWKKLPDDFNDAVEVVSECASESDAQYLLTFVHIHPKWIEACDNTQLIRYRVKTELGRPYLIKKATIAKAASMGMSEIAETPAWLHLRNPSGLVFSCRLHVGDYKDLTSFLKESDKGSPILLPPSIVDAAIKAEVFSSEDKDNNRIKVDLRPGKIRVQGNGMTGRYRRVSPVKYNGKPLSFFITPKLLAKITEKYNNCSITSDNLRVDGGKFTYLACLEKSDEKDQ